MEAPEAFGHYTLVERIAVGGMAEVFLARSTEERMRGRPLVVKRMLPQLAGSAEHVTMFLDEARLGALLKHKNIVEVLDIGEIDKSWYMTLEYIDGPDLGQILKTARDARQPLPNPFAVMIIARAAEGLHFAHNVTDPKTGAPLNLVHRDVSPQNLLVARDGAVKVADFGVAKSELQHHQTQSGLVKGKISYMSPEQISAQTLDPRTDVLSLGVSLWESLTHRRLYGGLGDVEIMKRVYYETPPPPSSTGVAIDPALEAIVAKSLVRKRTDRYGSARELMEALDGWAAAQAVPPTQEALAEWMQSRFVPRAVVADAATGWAFKSPARGSQADQSREPSSMEGTETTEIDDNATMLEAERAAARELMEQVSDRDSEIDATATTERPLQLQKVDEAPLAGGPPPPPSSSSRPSLSSPLTTPPPPAGLGSRATPATPRSGSVGRSLGSAEPTPQRRPLPKGTILKPISRGAPKPVHKRDLVLYVEDEQQNWEVAELLLKKSYDLLHAPDDQMACEILRLRGRELTAVLMDIQLKGSELDGIELVKLIRGTIGEKLPTYARGIAPLKIPIFFMTAYAARYSERELLAVGADKLVTKPVDFPQLTLALTSYQLRRAAESSGGS